MFDENSISFVRVKPCLLPIWLFLLFLIITQSAYCQEKSYQFQHLNEGLSHSNVTTILEDSKGFLWLGTRNGLNRYNGLEFDIYEPDPMDSTSIGHAYIFELVEDRQKDIWIATYGGGLSHYMPDYDRFENFVRDVDDPTSINSDYIFDIFEDSEGMLWLATNFGVGIFDPISKKVVKKYIETEFIRTILEDSKGRIWVGGVELYLMQEDGSFKNISQDASISPNIHSHDLRSIVEDKFGNLWFGTWSDGLFKLIENDDGSFHFKSYGHDPNRINSLSHNGILAMSPDRQGNLWIGTENGGLNKYDIANDQFHHYKHDPRNLSSISSNSIWAISEDKSGRIWLGTFGKGLEFIDPFQKEFSIVSADSPNGLSGNAIMSFVEDGLQNVWIAIDGSGLNYYNTKHQTIYAMGHNPLNKNSPLNNAILSIELDAEDNLLMGTWAGGMSHYNKRTQEFRHYLMDPEDSTSLSINFVHNIKRDLRNPTGFWIGTWGAGLDYFDLQTETFKHYGWHLADPEKITHANIYTIEHDADSNVWVGTESGLNRLIWNKWTQGYQVERYFYNAEDPTSLSENSVVSLYCDSMGRIWIGTNNGGLNLFLPETKTFKSFNKAAGLPSNSIASIEEDNAGNLWLGTSMGLSKVIVTGKRTDVSLTFRNYDKSDGLQGNFFNVESVLKTSTGELYFGGNDGLNKFHPDSIKLNTTIPPVYLTGLKLFNQQVEISDKPGAILTKQISEMSEIRLNHTQNVFTLEFIALNYTRPEKNQYAYFMEGIDKDWNYIGNKRSATYTTLDPGTYTFKVKGSNNDGVWNEQGTSLKIVILPPFWKTPWFRFLLTITSVAMLLVIIRVRTKNIIEKKNELEKHVQKRTKELKATLEQLQNTQAQLIQSEKMASLGQLTAGIAHEVNNPLTFIAGGLSELDHLEEDIRFDNEESKETLHNAKQMIQEGLQRSTSIIKALLTLLLSKERREDPSDSSLIFIPS